MRLTIASTGGTIASTGGSDGARPTKTGAELVERLPEIGESVTVDVVEVASVSSFELAFEHLSALADAVSDAVAAGSDGVVVTHGTDTMEETAYFLDLTVAEELPVICTGAQRRPDERSSDGEANLLTAVRAASDDRFRSAGGAYIAFNDEVHAARHVTKTHTSKVETFASPGYGPVAHDTRQGFRFARDPRSYSASFSPTRIGSRVDIVSSAVGVDGRQLRRGLADGVDGFVLAGTGLGNATPALADAVAEAVDDDVPVVVTSRCHAGFVAPVYGADGGAKVLSDHGALMGGDLSPQKARLKLSLALETTDDRAELRDLFEADSEATSPT